MATESFTGPIDYLVFAFPPGARADVGLQLLLDRVDAGLVEILDLECIARGDDGSVARVPLDRLATEGGFDLSVFEGVESGILDADDLTRIAGSLDQDWTAVAVVYEERSLAAVGAAWEAAGARLLLAGGVGLDDLEAALEVTQNEERMH